MTSKLDEVFFLIKKLKLGEPWSKDERVKFMGLCNAWIDFYNSLGTYEEAEHWRRIQRRFLKKAATIPERKTTAVPDAKRLLQARLEIL